jgi:hypothetical protein
VSVRIKDDDSFFLLFRFVYEFNRVKASSNGGDSDTAGGASQGQLKKTD